MLCISRKRGTSFTIGDNITITILKVANNVVRIGITAPKDIQVSRDNAKKGKVG